MQFCCCNAHVQLNIRNFDTLLHSLEDELAGTQIMCFKCWTNKSFVWNTQAFGQTNVYAKYCTSHALHCCREKWFVNWTLHAIFSSPPTTKALKLDFTFFNVFGGNVLWSLLTNEEPRWGNVPIWKTKNYFVAKSFLLKKKKSLCPKNQCCSKNYIHWSGTKKYLLLRPDGVNLTGRPHRSDASSL